LMELRLTSVTALHFCKDGGKLLVDVDHAVYFPRDMPDYGENMGNFSRRQLYL
jgi:hypothetical protein